MKNGSWVAKNLRGFANGRELERDRELNLKGKNGVVELHIKERGAKKSGKKICWGQRVRAKL